MATKPKTSKPAAPKADAKPAPAPAKAEKTAPAKPAPEKKQPAAPKPTGSEVTDRFDKPVRRLSPKDWVAKMKSAPRLTPVVGVVVFSKDEYDDPNIPLDARSFRCASDAPLFMGTGDALDGDSLDGVDKGMTLESMLDGPDKWEVDYCYIPKVGGFPLHPRYFLDTPARKDELGQFYGGTPTNGTAEAIIKSMHATAEQCHGSPPSKERQRAIREAGASGLLDRLLVRSARAQAFAKTKTSDTRIQDAVGILMEIRDLPALYSEDYINDFKTSQYDWQHLTPEGRKQAEEILAEWEAANPPDHARKAPDTKRRAAKEVGDAIHEHLYSGHDKRTEKVWGVKPNGEPVRKAKAPAKAGKGKARA